MLGEGVDEARYLLKEPKQQRSRDTIDALVEATELILVEEGWAGVNTNRIAERAGVSIGTLYQYFENKEALVGLMVERFVAGQQVALGASLWERLSEDMDLERMIFELVRALMWTHQERPELSRALLMHVPASGQLGVVNVWTERSRVLIEEALRFKSGELREGMERRLRAVARGNVVRPTCGAWDMVLACGAPEYTW